ncbi:MAG: O-antigen ligase family protein [Dehalococcoidales bacterium]
MNQYTWWLIIFIVWCGLSVYWALSQDTALLSIKTTIAQIIILVPLSMLIRNRKEFNIVLKVLAGSITVTLFFLMLIVDKSTIGQTRLSAELWNANSIGIMAGISVLIYVYQITRVKPAIKIIYMIIISFSVWTVLFSGSRKGLFILVAGVALYYYLNSQSKNIRTVLVVSALVFFSYYSIMNISTLYAVLGIRVEKMISSFTGTGLGDSSTETRINMAKWGLLWFKEQPLIGYGANNYRLLYSLVGRNTYAHNNYIELLVGTGIIGLIIYYYMPFAVIRKFTAIIDKKDAMKTLFYVLFILIVVTDLGMVTYDDNLIQLIICLGSAFMSKKSSAYET